MEDIITLNGIKYVKCDKIKDMEFELANLKKIIQDIAQLIDLSDDRTVENPKWSRININDGAVFKIPATSQKLWEIKSMNGDGEFVTKSNHKLKVTIKEVFITQKEMTLNSTVKEARELRKRLGINPNIFNKLLYNIREGVFDKFIQEWNKQTQPVIGKKRLPIENNVEKRKEKGYGGGLF